MKNSVIILALVAVIAGAPSQAAANVVQFDVNPDQTISRNTPPGSVSFGNIDLFNGTYTLNSTAGFYFELAYNNPTAGALSTSTGSNIKWGMSSFFDVAKLGSGVTISAASFSSWDSTYAMLIGNGGTGGTWADGGNAYAALRYQNFGSSFYNYGWVNLDVDNVAGTVTVNRFAFESQYNTPITTPEIVPEPSTYALLALAAAGFGAHVLRRRRR